MQIKRPSFHPDNRIYESAGKKSSASIDLPFEIRNLHEVDLNGSPVLRSITKNQRRLEIDIKPWEIVTMEIS